MYQKIGLQCLSMILIGFSVVVNADEEADMKSTGQKTLAVAEVDKEESVRDSGLEAVYKLPAIVSDVSQVCPWRSKSGKGVIRLARTEQKGAHQLYVQWVREGLAGTETQAISTIPINELNKHGPYRFKMPSGKLQQNACRLVTEMENLKNKRRFRVTLYLKGPGDYDYQVTSLLDGDLY